MRCQEKTDNALPQEKKPKPKKKVEPSRNDRIVKDLKKKVASLKNSVSRLETHVLQLKRKNKTRGMRISRNEEGQPTPLPHSHTTTTPKKAQLSASANETMNTLVDLFGEDKMDFDCRVVKDALAVGNTASTRKAALSLHLASCQIDLVGTQTPVALASNRSSSKSIEPLNENDLMDHLYGSVRTLVRPLIYPRLLSRFDVGLTHPPPPLTHSLTHTLTHT
jgi:hypothetical protein